MIQMSFKKFSTAQDAPTKDKSDDKKEAAAAAGRPVSQPDKAQAANPSKP